MKLISISKYDVRCSEMRYETGSHEHDLLHIEGIEIVNLATVLWVEVFTESMIVNFQYAPNFELRLEFKSANDFEDFCEKMKETV